MMTDDVKAVVWEASFLPFGAVDTLSGPASLDYRFPGQWFQLESGLHYNWHRHYDPTTGRYLQPDPLGMPDGPNRWAYALNSPLMKIDPEGTYQIDPKFTPYLRGREFQLGGLGLGGAGRGPQRFAQLPKSAPASPPMCVPIDMPEIYDPDPAPPGQCRCNCRVVAGRDVLDPPKPRFATHTMKDSPSCRATAIEACRKAKRRINVETVHHQQAMCSYNGGRAFPAFR
ncbi:MAG: RHS repeat domain-containing protein [Neoaquamicrobium sediminum]|uniref:RHS repeat domain-containing protein n=1 Tax=Neoaquamicrobium sediminum TaxID=1849104 RepID=UPI0040374002